MKKEYILQEIRRTAETNGGTAVGVDRFEQETGITPWNWQKFWPRFGDAVREAGCPQSEFIKAYDETELLGKYAKLAQELGRLPVRGDLLVKAHTEQGFPSHKVFDRWGGKPALVKRLMVFCQGKPEYQDVLHLCAEYVPRAEKTNHDAANLAGGTGSVYLIKSGRFYKIGKTNAAGRRGYELAIQLPEKAVQIHRIETDDPSGVEAYWHNRFRDKRKNGEWFDLNPADISAFKRWRKIA